MWNTEITVWKYARFGWSQYLDWLVLIRIPDASMYIFEILTGNTTSRGLPLESSDDVRHSPRNAEHELESVCARAGLTIIYGMYGL
jgi:hypothetical protein